MSLEWNTQQKNTEQKLQKNHKLDLDYSDITLQEIKNHNTILKGTTKRIQILKALEDQPRQMKEIRQVKGLSSSIISIYKPELRSKGVALTLSLEGFENSNVEELITTLDKISS